MCTGLEILGLVGSGISAAGQLKSGKEQSQALQRDAQIRQQSAGFEADRLREDQDRLAGRQRALAGKSGATSSGSILDTMRASAESAELDALNIQFGAKAGVQSDLFAAKQAKQAGKIGAASTLLSGAARTFK